jgi:hypothetical protein
MIVGGTEVSDMSIVVVVTALAIPKHRARAVAAFEKR